MATEDDIIQKLADAKTRDDGFRVLLKAIKDNQNNPTKLAQIAASIDENEGAWTSAFAEGVPPEAPPAT